MSTIKISQLPETTHLNPDTNQTIMVGVDLSNDTTNKFKLKTLAEGLYSNDVLNVGNNAIVLGNVIGQFVGSSNTFVQLNIENNSTYGSADIVITADTGNDTKNFLDLGLNNSNFNNPGYSSMGKLDGYLFIQGTSKDSYDGNLVIGTTSSNSQVVLAVGGTESGNVVGRISKSSFDLLKTVNVTGNVTVSSVLKFGDSTQQITAASPASVTQLIFDTANNISGNTVYTQGVDISQNTRIAAAFDKANNALANTTGTFAGNLTFTGTITTPTVVTQNSIVFRDGSSIGYNLTASPATMLISTADSLMIETNQGTSEFTFGTLGFSSAQGITSSGNTNLLSYVTIQKPDFNSSIPLITINASDDGAYVAPSNSYYMMHITGKSNNATRVVIDSFGANTYPLVSGRMARGTAAAPTATANNDVLMRIVGNGYTGTQFTPSSPAKIDFVASENYTNSNKGSVIQFWNTPNGSNTIQKIASFNANSVEFTGSIIPEKGFIYLPKTFNNAQTAITLDFANDNILRAQTATGLTVTLSNFVYGKMVEMWITNTSNNGQTFTHGCSALNSTVNSTTYTIPATSSILARYMSFDGDLANTFVSIIHS